MTSTFRIIGSQDSRSLCKEIAVDLVQSGTECFANLVSQHDWDKYIYYRGFVNYVHWLGKAADCESILKGTEYNGDSIAYNSSIDNGSAAFVMRLPEMSEQHSMSYPAAAKHFGTLEDTDARQKIYSALRGVLIDMGEEVTHDTPLIILLRSETKHRQPNTHQCWVHFSHGSPAIEEHDCLGSLDNHSNGGGWTVDSSQ